MEGSGEEEEGEHAVQDDGVEVDRLDHFGGELMDGGEVLAEDGEDGDGDDGEREGSYGGRQAQVPAAHEAEERGEADDHAEESEEGHG